jgi:uncharacterized protein (TIRG00374 family)
MMRVMSSPLAKVIISLLIGLGLLLVVFRFVNLAAILYIVQQNLMTPRGIICALLSGVFFLLAFSIRGIRWRLFLCTINSSISVSTAIRLFLVSIFINFLLPISGGDIAKTLMLKRIAAIPISRSLPTVAMDRALDLLPAFAIMAIVPLLGVHMEFRLWLVLGTVSGLLIVLACFIGLTVWKRTAAIALLRKTTAILPKSVGGKMEAFATGFVDSLLAAASRPQIFLPAVALTCLAVICDSLFAMLAFWTIGFPIPFGTAIFGYTVYNMFYIFPTPPGQIGSNEAVGLLVFTGLLHLPADKVTAMFVFSHPWAALLMTTAGLICLKTLGLTLSNTMRMRRGGSEMVSKIENEEVFYPEKEKLPVEPV